MDSSYDFFLLKCRSAIWIVVRKSLIWSQCKYPDGLTLYIVNVILSNYNKNSQRKEKNKDRNLRSSWVSTQKGAKDVFLCQFHSHHVICHMRNPRKYLMNLFYSNTDDNTRLKLARDKLNQQFVFAETKVRDLLTPEYTVSFIWQDETKKCVLFTVHFKTMHWL